MKRLLSLGPRRFAIELADGREGGADRLGDHAREAAWLRQLFAEPQNRPALRRLLDDAAPASAVRRLADADVLGALGRLLLSGRVRLREAPLPWLPSYGGDEASADDQAPADAAPRAPRTELTWVEIRLIGEDDMPIPHERYRVELPDGSIREGSLDHEGRARLDGIDPGTCLVTFPALDQEAWERVG
ncbi:hypothetical protein BE21_30560 [Sorangium cellulosum]|uniref:Uncharacterized protein n=1 Tax=Sorangium cellulosum TaxID=56 RepID=A0A150TR81_SORCE|nr:hypothetical protein BE21_30560 [Sorangium cellulosum]